MAKKFGKVLFLTAAVASAAAAVYIYLQKRDAAQSDLEEEDYDDFSEDTEKDTDGSRNYVPLNHETSVVKNAENTENASEAETASSSVEKASEDAPDKEKTFTPLTEQVAQAAENTADTVEEFFDEEDGNDEEPPISDN